MTKELDFLRKNNEGFLATVDESGKPRVRGWGILRVDDDKLVFGTSHTKKVFSQLKVNPFAEWISLGENFTSLRVSGNIRFEDNKSVKEKIGQENPLLQQLYANSNEEFEIFYLENLEYDWYITEIPPEFMNKQ
ncbi:MAG: pyridoxamine 5'-phosphate oxidase family protein [Rhodothermaceae bacterium]